LLKIIPKRYPNHWTTLNLATLKILIQTATRVNSLMNSKRKNKTEEQSQKEVMTMKKMKKMKNR
jgi:hypothetical protein